jgi:hypothetical protein
MREIAWGSVVELKARIPQIEMCRLIWNGGSIYILRKIANIVAFYIFFLKIKSLSIEVILASEFQLKKITFIFYGIIIYFSRKNNFMIYTT